MGARSNWWDRAGASADAAFRRPIGRKRGFFAALHRRFPAGPVRLFVCLIVLAWPPVGPASALDIEAAAVAWERLVFRPPERADDLSVEVKLSEVSAADLALALSSTGGEQATAPVDGQVLLMTSTIDVFMTGRAYQTDIWFRSAGVSPLQRRRDKTGKDPNRKIFRYLADGVQRLRIEPKGRAEAELAPDLWTGVREHFFPFGAALEGCPIVSDPGLLFLIAAAVTRASEPLALCVFNKKAIYLVQLSADSDTALAMDYVEVSGAGRNQVHREAKARKIRIEAVPPGGKGVESEPFEFFEMGGEIEIDVEAESGLPLRIAGEIGSRRVELILSEAVLRP